MMERFPYIFIVLGITLFTITTIGAALVTNPPKHYNEILKQIKKDKEKEKEKKNSGVTKQDEEQERQQSQLQQQIKQQSLPSRAMNRDIVRSLVTHLQNSNATSSAPTLSSGSIDGDIISVGGSSSLVGGIGSNNNVKINMNINKGSVFENGMTTSMLTSMTANTSQLYLNVSMLSHLENEKNEEINSSVLKRSKIDFIDETNVIGDDDNNANIVTTTLISQRKSKDTKKRQSKSKITKDETLFKNVVIPSTKKEIIEFFDNDIPEFSYSKKEALCSLKFYHICFIDFLNSLVIIFVASQWKLFAINYLDINNDEFLVWLGSFSSIFNAIGKILFAYLFDYSKSFKLSMSTITLLMCVFVSTICISGLWYSEELLFVWISVLSVCSGGNYSLYGSTISQSFGIKNSGIILGFLFISEIPGAISSSYLFDSINGIVGSWFNLSIIMGIGAGISTILSLTYNTKNSKKIEFLKQHNIEY